MHLAKQHARACVFPAVCDSILARLSRSIAYVGYESLVVTTVAARAGAAVYAMFAVIFFAPGLRGQTVSVSAPAWWAERGALAGLPAADTATVSAQQLYQFALAALLELDGKLAGAGGATGTLSAAAALLGTPQPLAGLHAEYFNSPDFSGSPVLLRQETTVGFDGGEGGSPVAPAPGVDARGFSARWAGELVPATGGLRVFEVRPTNGTASLWVNGLPIPPGDRFALPLSANQPVSILLEYTAPASANDAAGLLARWGFGPNPAAGQDNFRLTEGRATTAGWQSVGTRELFGLNTLNYESGESVESSLASGQTLLTGGPLVRLADANYYNYSGWFHTGGLSGDAVLAYASDYGPLGWGGLSGTVGPWEIAGTPVGGVLALTPSASLGSGTMNLTYIADTADGWLYFGLFSAADFSAWNAMTALGEGGALGDWRAYENLALLNGTVGRLRAFALALRARLAELGYRDLPALPDGEDTAVLTVGDLKALLRFDLDADADGDGRGFAQELLAGTNPYDWYDGEAPIVTVIAGDGQSGPDGWALGAPLVVRVTRPNGAPLVGAPVTAEPTEDSALRVDASVPASGSGPAPAPNSPAVSPVFHTDAEGRLILTVGLTPGAAEGAHAMVFRAGRDPLDPPPNAADLCVAAAACVPSAPPQAPEFAPTATTGGGGTPTPPEAARYLVIPLSDFGWPEGVVARELDDHGGVLGGGAGGDAIYWRPGMAAPVSVPVLDMRRDFAGGLPVGAGWDYWRALELSRHGGAARGPWDEFPLQAGLHGWSSAAAPWPWSALPGFSVRRLSSDGRVAGWLPAGTGTDSEGSPLMSGTRPAVWQYGVGTVSYATGQASAGLVWTDAMNMSMGLVTGAAVAVNKQGALAGWETRSSRSVTFSAWPAEVPYPPPNPEGATYTGTAWAGGGAYTQSAQAWRRTAGLPEAATLPGTLTFSAWDSDAGNDAAWSAGSSRAGPGGTAFLPQFLGDTGLLAGQAVTVSTSPASATYNWGMANGEGYVTGNSYWELIAHPILTARPAVWVGTESVSRAISFSGFIASTATLSGVTHGAGGTEARVFGTALAAGAGGRVAWSARASTGWKAEPLKADGGDGRLSPLNPSGAFDLNDRGDMVFGDDRVVIDGTLIFLGGHLASAGFSSPKVTHLNRHGMFLAAQVTHTATGSSGTIISATGPALGMQGQFKLRDNNDVTKGWDYSGDEPWTWVATGGTNSMVKFALASPEMAQTIFATYGLEVAFDSESHIEVLNARVEGSDILFEIRGKQLATPEARPKTGSPTSQGRDGARIILRKNNNPLASALATLHVRVFEPRIVPVDIYFAHSASVPSSSVSDHPSKEQIVEELNAVFGLQANIQFQVKDSDVLNIDVFGLSVFRDVGSVSEPGTSNSVYVLNGVLQFPTDGDWSRDRHVSAVRNAASVRATAGVNTLKIFGVHRIYLPGRPAAVGLTLQGAGPCFVSIEPDDMANYSHEVGHALGLSVLDITFHDKVRFVEMKGAGTLQPLMYDGGTRSQPPQRWLRQQDWDKANHMAPNYK
jgi:hypothetical protein